jgi:hypothetical protein
MLLKNKRVNHLSILGTAPQMPTCCRSFFSSRIFVIWSHKKVIMMDNIQSYSPSDLRGDSLLCL